MIESDVLGQWREMWRDLGVAAPERLDALCGQVWEAYSEPYRHYHTTQHLIECFANFRRLQDLCVRPAEVELAIWFHDAVYDPKAADNEQRSADWMRKEALAAGVGSSCADRVSTLILATRHDGVDDSGEDADRSVLLDVDLAILATDPPRFEQYGQQVRAEYAWVPEMAYRQRRAALLESLLSRPHIYLTQRYQIRLESSARANLRHEIQRLTEGQHSRHG